MNRLVIFLLFGTTFVMGEQSAPRLSLGELQKIIASWRDEPMPERVGYLIARMVNENNERKKLSSGPVEYKEYQRKLRKHFAIIDDAGEQCKIVVEAALRDTGLDLKAQKEIAAFFYYRILRRILDRFSGYENYADFLTSKGKFVAAMYDRMPYPFNTLLLNFIRTVFASPSDSTASKNIHENIVTELVLRNTDLGSEVRREYFLRDDAGNKIDNESNDGKTYYFYSEKIENAGFPPLLLVDKRWYGRSWFQYIYNILKHPAIAVALGFGAYGVSQTQQGKSALQFIKTSRPVQYISDKIK